MVNLSIHSYAVVKFLGKFLLMLQSIKRAQAIDAENGELHSIIADFILACESSSNGLKPSKIRVRNSCCCLFVIVLLLFVIIFVIVVVFPPSFIVLFFLDEETRLKLPDPVQQVIDSARDVLTDGKSLIELNQEFLRKHEYSLDHMISGGCGTLLNHTPC